jgi:hypothetical protein
MKNLFHLVLLALLVAVCAAPALARAQDDSGWLLGQINALRASKGLGALSANAALNAAATGHSVYLANNEWTDAHIQANGSTPRSRMTAAGYTGSFVGENVYGGGMATASIAFNWWVGSALHYANMTNARYTEIGIGIARGTRGTFYTLNFGGGGGAAPAQPPAAAPSGNNEGDEPAPPVRAGTRPPTRRPLPSAIPTNTPGPSLTPSQTFTAIPSKAVTDAPQSQPTETPIIFEIATDAPSPIPAVTLTGTKIAAAFTLTPLPSMIPPTPAAIADNSTNGAMNSPIPTAIPTITAVMNTPTEATTPPEPSTAGGSSGSDPIRTLIPLAIGLQVIILGGVALRRGKH